MLFLVELDHVKPGTLSTPELGRVPGKSAKVPLVGYSKRKNPIVKVRKRGREGAPRGARAKGKKSGE